LSGEIRIKTLKKFLNLVDAARDRKRSLEAQEISEEIGCCKSHAYNYKRALDLLLESMIA
jgi:GR25 family glycosyltransferase involved in LPS biosynthesis